jgi:transposase-like protein
MKFGGGIQPAPKGHSDKVRGMLREVQEMYEGGKSVREIGRELGVAGETVRRVLTEEGNELRPQIPQEAAALQTPEAIAKVKEMYEGGASLRAIGREFNVSYPTIQRLLGQNGVETRKPKGPSQTVPDVNNAVERETEIAGAYPLDDRPRGTEPRNLGTIPIADRTLFPPEPGLAWNEDELNDEDLWPRDWSDRMQRGAKDEAPPLSVEFGSEPVEYGFSEDRVPFIFNIPQNRLYVGRPGTTHNQVEEEFGLPEAAHGGSVPDWTGGELWQHGTLSWFALSRRMPTKEAIEYTQNMNKDIDWPQGEAPPEFKFGSWNDVMQWSGDALDWVSEKGLDADAAMHGRIHPEGCDDEKCWICNDGQRPNRFETPKQGRSRNCPPAEYRQWNCPLCGGDTGSHLKDEDGEPFNQRTFEPEEASPVEAPS